MSASVGTKWERGGVDSGTEALPPMLDPRKENSPQLDF